MLLLKIILAVLAVSLISLIGVFFFFKKKEYKKSTLRIFISFAVGALLAVVFLNLLPEGVHESKDPHLFFLIVFISILVFFLLEKFIHWHHCCCDECDIHKDEKKHIAYISLVGDGVHNFLDGLLIAAAFLVDIKLGLVTTLAVALHEIPQEISDFAILIYAGFSKLKALMFNFIFALTALIGALLGYFVFNKIEGFLPYLIAVAAGNFIYLAMADLIPEIHHEKNLKRFLYNFIFLLLGGLLIYGVHLFLEH